MAKFIDTSHHKGVIDWDKVATTDVEGVILKATDGFFMPIEWGYDNYGDFTNHVDYSFTLYWKELKGKFKWRGAYHFLRVDDEIAKTKGRPTSQEQIYLFKDVMDEYGYEWNDYIILDIEQSHEQLDYLEPRLVAERTENAIRLTHELFGRKPLIYTAYWWWEKYHKYFNKSFTDQYFYWLAHYWPIDANNDIEYSGYYYYIKPNRYFPPEWRDDLKKRIAYARLPVISDVPTINPDKVIGWQYTSSGDFSGINSRVDTNRETLPESEWHELRGEDPTEPPVEPPIDPEKNCLIEAIKNFFKAVGDCLGGK